MPIITEVQLNTAIKSGNFSPVYFFYGEESFLVKTYAVKIKNTLLGSAFFNCWQTAVFPTPIVPLMIYKFFIGTPPKVISAACTVA